MAIIEAALIKALNNPIDVDIHMKAMELLNSEQVIVRAVEDLGSRGGEVGPLARPPAHGPERNSYPPEFTPPTRIIGCHRYLVRGNYGDGGIMRYEPGWSGQRKIVEGVPMMEEAFGWQCERNEPEFQGQRAQVDNKFEVIYLRPSEDGFALVQGPGYISKVGYEAITSITAPPFTPPNWNR